MFQILQMAVLLGSTPLCSPFQLYRPHLPTASQLFMTRQGPSIRLEMTVRIIDSDGTNTDAETVMGVTDELKLTQSKLKVLEHVVKKMKNKSEESAASWAKRLAQEKEKQAKTLGESELLKKKYKGAEGAFADERNQLGRQIETMTSEYETSLGKSTKKISDLTKREGAYKRDLKDYEAKFIQMEEKLAKMTHDRRDREAAWESEKNRHNSILEDQRRKEEELSAELDDVYAERDEIMAKLKETRQRRNVDIEAMEKAKSSLVASENRVLILEEKYAALQNEYDNTQREIQFSRQTIAAMEENTRFLEAKVQSASKAIDAGLKEEVETLKKAIVDLRMQHNSQLKKQQRDTEIQLSKMRDDHYKQVQQFRKTVLERNDSVETKGLWQRVRKLFRRS